MKHLRRLLERNTLFAWLIATAVGVLLWQSDFQDRRSDEELKADTTFTQVLRTFWPPDGQAGWGAPIPGNLGSAWRFKSYDWLFLLRHAFARPSVPPEVLILSMDENSHSTLQQPQSAPWDRRIHADTLERVLTNGARAVVFDIVFDDQKRCVDLEADAALAEAVRTGSNRVVVAYSTRKGEHRWIPIADPPYVDLRRALIQSAAPEVKENRYYAGLPEVEPDYDQRVRRHPPSYQPNKHSLAWSVAGLLQLPCLTQTNRNLRAPEEQERWMNYYGPAGFLDVLPYYQVTTNDVGASPAPGVVFSNRVVFIGSGTLTKFSGERKDAYINPFAALSHEADRFIAGVEIHATAALNLIRGDWLTRWNLRPELILILSTALLAALVFPRLGAWAATTAAVGGILGFTGVAYGLFISRNLWFAWLIPVTQIAVVWLFSLIANSARLYVQNRLYQQQLGLYLSPKLVRKFAQDREQTFTRPGATKHELTIFFSDIAGFTSISEGLDSDDLARLMNQYFQTSVGNCIFPEDGTVVKYIGDAIFAFWNAPDPQTDHAARACRAALRFRQQKILSVNEHPLITRIGLHTGVANVGNFGSTQRIDYTAIGENINLASRMEGLNKHIGTETLVTEATYRLVSDAFTFRPLGRYILKGFEHAFGVYELCASRERAPEFAELHAAFAQALANFQRGDLAAATQAFTGIQARWPNDGPTKFYLHTLEELVYHPHKGEWTGTIELKEK